MTDIAIATTLITGAIWARRNKNTQEDVPCTVLFVTNEELSDKLKETYPPQVVFRTKSGRVQSMPIPDFVKGRHYVSMDQMREQLLKTSLQDLDDDEDEEVDIEGLEVPATVGEANSMEDLLQAFGTPAADTGEVSGLDREPVPVVITLPEGPGNDYTQALLNGNFVSYSEGPAHGAAEGDTEHVLRFQLGHNLTLASLRKIFGFETGQVSDFTVSLSGTDPFRVEADAIIGAFLEGSGVAIGAIHMTSSGDINMVRATQALQAHNTGVSEAVVINTETNTATLDVLAKADAGDANQVIDMHSAAANAAAATAQAPAPNPNQSINMLAVSVA